MDAGPIPKGARYDYYCEKCGNKRGGAPLDHPMYSWRCPECGGYPRVVRVEDENGEWRGDVYLPPATVMGHVVATPPAAETPAHVTPARPRSHTLAIAQLRDWLEQPQIRKALISTGTATKAGMRLIYSRLEEMDEAGLWATTAVFVKDKRVRRVIAAHQAKVFKMPKADVLRGLLELAEAGR